MVTNTAHTRAVEYLNSIIEGSPEDDSLIWFANATYENRAAAFVKLEMEVSRLRALLEVKN